MKQNTTPIIGRIVVTQQSPAGIVATVNGKATLFRDRQDLFRAAVLLAETGAKARKVHPPPVKGA
jgi:hypothetical protein